MNRFTAIADEFLDGFNGTDINSELTKFAKDRGMSAIEHQRLIEETNVSSFLRRLNTNEHYNDFTLAEPVLEMTMSPIESTDNPVLQKVASYSANASRITYDMFSLGNDDVEFTRESTYDSSQSDNTMHLNAIEEKELIKKEASELMHAEMEENSMVLKKDIMISDITNSLIKIANDSPSSAKFIAVCLTKQAMTNIAENVVIGCKYNRSDIINARLSGLEKTAKESANTAVEAAKSIIALPVAAVRAALKTGNFVVENKKLVAGAGGAAYLADKMSDKADDSRTRMMINTRKGE